MRTEASDITLQVTAGQTEPTEEQFRKKIMETVQRYRDLPEDFEETVAQLFRARARRKQEMTAQERGNELFETWLSSLDISHDAWRAEHASKAMFLVRLDLLLDAVAQTEGLEASPADVDAMCETLASESGTVSEQVREAVDLDSVAWQIRRDKARQLILDCANRRPE